MSLLLFPAVFFLLFSALVVYQVYHKNLWIWLGSYIRQAIRGAPKVSGDKPIHIIFCMVDHFEPIQGGSSKEEERERMGAWLEGYPKMACKHGDSNGRPPQHTWFYPGEAYSKEYLDGLVELCNKGFGDIEFHHHHYHQTSGSLRQAFLEGLEKFSHHGALVRSDDSGQSVYGFIHGNMALDNSRFDDQWCGVNDELTILKETGCYADFSAPNAPCISQARKINAIYYAEDNPREPKSHDDGVDVEVAAEPSGDLMIIQGPLALNWKRRKMGIFPKIENAEILGSNPGTPDRIDLWVKQHIYVKGRPEWIFVKTSCHGAQNENFDVLLGNQADALFSYLEQQYRDQGRYKLHYVTARELYNIVKAAEQGEQGDPARFYDYAIPPYRYR